LSQHLQVKKENQAIEQEVEVKNLTFDEQIKQLEAELDAA